jgi:mannose-6-phosphate isomerase-like protein (cupin superfamily)
MDAFEITELVRRQAKQRGPYLEFLRVPDLSLGLYVLPAGGTDRQKPHTEAEVYYVVNGAATVTIGGEDRPVRPGSIVFVDKQVPHKFHTITEELTLLVFFAPAENDPKPEATA